MFLTQSSPSQRPTRIRPLRRVNQRGQSCDIAQTKRPPAQENQPGRRHLGHLLRHLLLQAHTALHTTPTPLLTSQGALPRLRHRRLPPAPPQPKAPHHPRRLPGAGQQGAKRLPHLHAREAARAKSMEAAGKCLLPPERARRASTHPHPGP